tara:strand:- start:296 stop:634 length:339 start_codon:yes stop_codon:yes gene_type:complete
MSILKVNTIQNTSSAHSSTPEQIAKGRAKVWASVGNNNGIIEINDSFNLSSVTDNDQGDYSLNFSTSMSNTNYCIVGMSDASITEKTNNRTAEGLRFSCLSSRMGIAVFGDT